MSESRHRNQEIALRFVGIAAFVIALFFLPVVGRSCGVPKPATATPGLTPGTDALPGTTTPSAVPSSTPTAVPTVTPVLVTVPVLVSPLTSPLSSPLIAPPAEGTIPVYTYRVVHAYPHDPEAFTQGLVYHEGALYEGTGLYGRSSLREVALETGEVIRSYALPETVFGEGIAILGDRLYQLTWRENKGFVYDWQSFDLLAEFFYPTEGWGLTHDGAHLIMSDGTPVLHFLDPEDLSEVRQLEVRDPNGPVQALNELEYVRGEVYADIWKTERIARIDPASGTVVGWIELRGLLPEADRAGLVDVLNGIAYDAEGDRLFVTGKLWPTLFEIELVPPQG